MPCPGNNTYFFWNMDDYPVPVDTDLATVRKNIITALRLMGFAWSVDICVDCKQPENVEQVLQGRGITYLPNCKIPHNTLFDLIICRNI